MISSIDFTELRATILSSFQGWVTNSTSLANWESCSSLASSIKRWPCCTLALNI